VPCILPVWAGWKGIILHTSGLAAMVEERPHQVAGELSELIQNVCTGMSDSWHSKKEGM